VLLKDQQIVAAKEKSNLECYILKLKDDVNYTQSNFLRERDRNIIGQDDVCKEIGILKK
jgi:predicted GNAT superfamily acetyltransferase